MNSNEYSEFNLPKWTEEEIYWLKRNNHFKKVEDMLFKDAIEMLNLIIKNKRRNEKIKNILI